MDKDRNDKINQNGKYSMYNYLYHFLLDNYEPDNLTDPTARQNAKGLLMKEGVAYARKGAGDNSYDTINQAAEDAINNFINNKGEHGGDGDNLGKTHENSFNTIKNTIQDLRW